MNEENVEESPPVLESSAMSMPASDSDVMQPTYSMDLDQSILTQLDCVSQFPGPSDATDRVFQTRNLGIEQVQQAAEVTLQNVDVLEGISGVLFFFFLIKKYCTNNHFIYSLPPHDKLEQLSHQKLQLQLTFSFIVQWKMVHTSQMLAYFREEFKRCVNFKN